MILLRSVKLILVFHNSKELTTTQALDNFRQSWLPWSKVSYRDTNMFSSCSDALKCSVIADLDFKNKLILSEHAKIKSKLLNSTRQVQNSKKLQVTIFPKLLFSSIIFYYHRYCFIRLPLHYKYLRYIRIIIVNTCLPAWNDMIGRRSDSIGRMSANGGLWLDDHWQCRYTSVLHKHHKHTLP